MKRSYESQKETRQKIMSSDELISKEEILAGLPARRANTLLFSIESRTAQLAARSQVEFSLTEPTIHDGNLAFLEAFALGNKPQLHPTIQQLERYAPGWANLIPNNPKLKAAIFHAFSQKYIFSDRVIPNIQTALSLDEKKVQIAYSRFYRRQLSSVFATKLPLWEKLLWFWGAIAQRLETLPPFWLACTITIALGFPQAFLALPIAVADLGAIATVIFVIIIGIINMLTMACMAEAIGRSGDFRYGNAFIKQLVANYLGNTGSLILSIAVGIRVFLIALACYIGLSTTIADFTHLPATVSAVLLFLCGLYLLSNRSLKFTVAVMVILAAINVSLLLLISFLAFQHLQLDNLLYVNLPFFQSDSFQISRLQQFFGVTLMLYFGHIYVGECAKLVLPRDPSASSLIWGSVAGTAFLTVLFCVWVLAVNGAISPQLLAERSGTVLEPLAREIGSIVTVTGTILVTLLLGMAWLRSSSLLVNLVREWIPDRTQPILKLFRDRNSLILHPPSNSSFVPHFGFKYLGLEETHSKFRLDIQIDGKIHHLEIAINEGWEINELLEQFPELREWDTRLKLEIQSADRDSACVQVISPMILDYENEKNSSLLPVACSPFPLPKGVKAATSSHSQKIWKTLLNQRRFFLSISPLILILLLTESLFLAGTQSFTSILAFAGVLGNSLVGGIFPILLLISSRQKGEIVPGVVFKILDRSLVSIGIYSLFSIVLLVHGLFIWENPIARISALCVALLSLVATIIMKNHGAFASRVVLEIREERSGGRTIFSISAGGRSLMAEILLGYAEGEQSYQASSLEILSLSSLRYAIFSLPTKQEKELKVWAHKNNFTNNSNNLPILLNMNSENQNRQFDLTLSKGKFLSPLFGNRCWLKLTFPQPSL
jgi:hypothetical protein